MARDLMTPEERAEFDALMYAAGYDANGKPYPSYEIGPRVIRMLSDAADQAQRGWAGRVRDDIVVAGALARWRTWNRVRDVIEVAGATYVTTKAATVGVRRSDKATGRTYYQASFWEDLTREELDQIVARSTKEITAEGRTIALARRLLALLDRVPEASTVAEAASALGLTTETYLAVVDTHPREEAA